MLWKQGFCVKVTQEKRNLLFHRDPMMHLVYPPPPPTIPQKNKKRIAFITIVFYFSWDL